MRKESLIVYNPRADRGKAWERAGRIKHTLKLSRACELSALERGEVRGIPDNVIIVGGDGTIRASVNWFVNHDENPNLFLAGGGTGNILRRSIEAKGARISPSELIDPQDLTKTSVLCRFGVIESGRTENLFVASAGFGGFEREWTKGAERLRGKNLPPLSKLYLAGLLSFWSNLKTKDISGDAILEVYSPQETVGPFKVFSENDVNLENSLLGSVEIEDENPQKALLKLMLTLACWQLGIKVPRSILSLKTGDEFFRQETGNVVNLDGDLKTIKGEGLRLKKSDRGFNVTAMIL